MKPYNSLNKLDTTGISSCRKSRTSNHRSNSLRRDRKTARQYKKKNVWEEMVEIEFNNPILTGLSGLGSK